MERNNTLEDKQYLTNELIEKPELVTMDERRTNEVFIESPLSTFPDPHPVNGNYAPDDDDDEDDVEEDLILGDEDEISGDEEEFDVELEEDVDVTDIDEDDLVIDTDDDVDEDDDL
jgi:hypothetical protein